MSARSNAQVTAAVSDAIGMEEVWHPSITKDGEAEGASAVAELIRPIEDFGRVSNRDVNSLGSLVPWH